MEPLRIECADDAADSRSPVGPVVTHPVMLTELVCLAILGECGVVLLHIIVILAEGIAQRYFVTQRQRCRQQTLDGRAPGVIIDRHPGLTATLDSRWKGYVDSDGAGTAPRRLRTGRDRRTTPPSGTEQERSPDQSRALRDSGFRPRLRGAACQRGTQSRKRNHVAGLEVQRPSITTRGFIEAAKLECRSPRLQRLSVRAGASSMARASSAAASPRCPSSGSSSARLFSARHSRASRPGPAGNSQLPRYAGRGRTAPNRDCCVPRIVADQVRWRGGCWARASCSSPNWRCALARLH